MLNAGKGDAIAHLFVGEGACGVALKVFAKVGAKGGARLFVKGKLASRQQLDFIDWIDAALGVYIKSTYRFYFIIKEIQSIRNSRAQGENVDNTPTNANIACGTDLIHMVVIGAH